MRPNAAMCPWPAAEHSHGEHILLASRRLLQKARPGLTPGINQMYLLVLCLIGCIATAHAIQQPGSIPWYVCDCNIELAVCDRYICLEKFPSNSSKRCHSGQNARLTIYESMMNGSESPGGHISAPRPTVPSGSHGSAFALANTTAILLIATKTGVVMVTECQSLSLIVPF